MKIDWFDRPGSTAENGPSLGRITRLAQRTLRLFSWIALLMWVWSAQSSLQAASTAKGANGFRHPPPSARPWVYWFWMDGNISREGITADLEAMRRVGLGGVILMEVDVGVPRGAVRFMSEPWRALFKHAVQETERLGLEITLNAGPGWTGSGGPWVQPEQSMQHLVASRVEVSGPSHFEGVLPRPGPREPHFVHAPIPPSLRQIRNEFYRDVAVLAFPTPAGEARIPESDEKALYYRNPYSSAPGVKPYLAAPAEYPVVAAGTAVDRDRVVELTERLDSDGRLTWAVPEGRWTILRFGRTSTGANTRPAPEPGIGLESDKFDRAALEAHFDSFIGSLLRELGPRPRDRKTGWTMLHIDSWEMGAQNWSQGFREAFRKRRGYDSLSYLPAITGQVVASREISERFLWDLRQTAQELVIENHARHLRTLGRRHGFGLSIEPYDMNPCSDLSLGGEADVPMCEFWAQGYGFNTAFSCVEAVSIGHALGRPIIAAEAFTADAPEAWRLYPGAMKAQADWALCFGINRLVFHRYAHQPWLDRVPGMTMGPYGTHYERTQTWWELTGPWHEYLARCQFLLRQGTPVADLCYLVPEGAPHVFRTPPSALNGVQPVPDRRGYNFDGCAPEVLRRQMSVKNGRLVLPGGMSYRILVLPNVETMTPSLLRKLRDLVRAGATVVGPRPRKSPSLSGYPNCDEEVRQMASELWGDTLDSAPRFEAESIAVEMAPSSSPYRVRRFGKGGLLSVPLIQSNAGQAQIAQIAESGMPPLYDDYERLAKVMIGLGISPDFESDQPIRYTHRHAGAMDIYFVANSLASPVRTRGWFRVAGRQPELWDPMDGAIRPLPEYRIENGRTAVPLEFGPHESFFVIFRREAPRRATAAGSNFPKMASVTQVNGPWEIEFQKGRGAPERISLGELVDWTTHPDDRVRHFSGTATYRAAFTLSAEQAARLAQARLVLDLGQVQVMARATLNGHDLGVAWNAPFHAEIHHPLQAGPNSLEITVANLWPNRLIGDQSRPAGERVAWSTWNPYRTNSALLPSGLLGPVRLLKRPD